MSAETNLSRRAEPWQRNCEEGRHDEEITSARRVERKRSQDFPMRIPKGDRNPRAQSSGETLMLRVRAGHRGVGVIKVAGTTVTWIERWAVKSGHEL